MTAPHNWPGALDAHEAEIDRDIGEGSRSTIADIPIWETDADIEELYIALQDADLRRDDAAHEADLIAARIDDLQEIAARAETRELRRDYYARVI